MTRGGLLAALSWGTVTSEDLVQLSLCEKNWGAWTQLRSESSGLAAGKGPAYAGTNDLHEGGEGWFLSVYLLILIYLKNF